MGFERCGKVDIHVHLSLEGKHTSGGTYFGGYREMLPHFQKQSITKAILVSGGETGSGLPGNEECRTIAQQDPEHYAWMCALDDTDPETVFERLCRYRREGAVGVGEVMINRRFEDPFMGKIFEAAGKLGMPVTFHMSPQVGVGYGVVDAPGLPLLEKALKAYPDTLFVGHSKCFWNEISADAPTDPAERNRSVKGPVLPGGRVVELMEKYPNLYGDLSAASGNWAILRDPDHGIAFLERFSQRLMFATDMINDTKVFPLGEWLDEQAAAGTLSRQTYERVCCQNALRIYSL